LTFEDNTPWYVLWTRSNCEQLVHDQLAAGGFSVFLPTIKTWSRRKDVRRTIALPMFPGYVFVHHAIDKTSYVAIQKARGLVRILGDRWDRLAPVAAAEIESIRRVSTVDAPVMPYPYLHEGQRVRITSGPLAGLEGLLVHVKPNKGLVVLSVELLRQSVAVEVDCTQVVPEAGSPVVSAEGRSGYGLRQLVL
jgi:transcription antitermination factor NusG